MQKTSGPCRRLARLRCRDDFNRATISWRRRSPAVCQLLQTQFGRVRSWRGCVIHVVAVARGRPLRRGEERKPSVGWFYLDFLSPMLLYAAVRSTGWRWTCPTWRSSSRVARVLWLCSLWRRRRIIRLDGATPFPRHPPTACNLRRTLRDR